MFAVAVTEPGKVEIVEVPDPVPGPYEALIKTEIAALCNSTDRKLIEAHFPGVEQYPLLLGHETVGTVVAVGEKARSFQVGDRVIGGLLLNSTHPDYASGWGGFSEYTLASDHVAMVEDGVADAAHGWVEVHEIMRTVPRTVPLEDAVLLCKYWLVGVRNPPLRCNGKRHYILVISNDNSLPIRGNNIEKPRKCIHSRIDSFHNRRIPAFIIDGTIVQE